MQCSEVFQYWITISIIFKIFLPSRQILNAVTYRHLYCTELKKTTKDTINSYDIEYTGWVWLVRRMRSPA